MMKIANIVNNYLSIYPNENELLSLLVKQTSSTSDKQLINRKNFEGHCTASSFVVSKTNKRVLLIDHKSLGLKLQPGGHIDQNESTVLQAAYRELAEETGITMNQVRYRPLIPGLPHVPFDIDTHSIPENTKKNELKHFHHDFRYLFLVDSESDIQINTDESEGFNWVSWEEFISHKKFKKTAKKIDELSAKRSEAHFFDNIFQKHAENLPPDTRLILIQHILPDSFQYIKYLHTKLGDNLEIFAKPKSIDKSVKQKLEDLNVVIKIASREHEPISYYLGNSSKKAIMLDIGGYFTEIARTEGLPVIGIIEDTENGHKKYAGLGDELKYPVMSVARSPLKDNEDRLVGESTVQSAENILRSQNMLFEYYRCAVIGYGKVGAGIAGRLLKSNIKPYVVEINPQRMLKAVNNYCYASTLTNALKKSRIIFCASGSKAIGLQELRQVRNGAYIISVTSSEDEFDLSQLDNEYTCEVVAPYIKRYSNERNYFYLINDGNAINFFENGAVGPYIFAVKAEILMLALKLSLGVGNRSFIESSTSTERDEIAQLWLDEFVTI